MKGGGRGSTKEGGGRGGRGEEREECGWGGRRGRGEGDAGRYLLFVYIT